MDESNIATGEAIVRARLRALVRDQPWLAVAAAATAGGVLGGIWFSRAGRLLFAATTGFVAHELWHREGQLGVNDLVAKLSGRASLPKGRAGESSDAKSGTTGRSGAQRPSDDRVESPTR